jgi:hypothetical protein
MPRWIAFVGNPTGGFEKARRVKGEGAEKKAAMEVIALETLLCTPGKENDRKLTVWKDQRLLILQQTCHSSTDIEPRKHNSLSFRRIVS